LASDKRRKKVRERIAALRDDERRRLYKRAARIRRAAPRDGRSKPKHRPDYETWNDGDGTPPPVEKSRRHYKGSLRQWAEALVEDGDFGQREQLSGPEPNDEGLVLFATSGRCRVLTASGETLDCMVASDLASTQRSDLAVGDRVQLFTQAEEATIVGVDPRSSVLSRPDSGPGGRFVERVVAANVDCAVIVASVRQPVLRPRLLDRYRVAIEHGGAQPVIAITKIDLLDAAECDAIASELAHYGSVGVPVIQCSSTDGRGLEALLDELQGGLSVFVGQSGVGKSSLLNALEPELAIRTLPTGRSNKGRHTTTASTLHRLPDGTQIIDTPGVREFGLWALSPDELRGYFREFDRFAVSCRFSDCSHIHEPGCAVCDAVLCGDLPASRYDSYRRLLKTLS
jgi:ribosome biogenesis GTPase